MAAKLTYETALRELEEIADKLDSGKLTLDESVRLYEKGRALSEFCMKCLDDAQTRVTVLDKDKKDDNADNGT